VIYLLDARNLSDRLSYTLRICETGIAGPATAKNAWMQANMAGWTDEDVQEYIEANRLPPRRPGQRFLSVAMHRWKQITDREEIARFAAKAEADREYCLKGI